MLKAESLGLRASTCRALNSLLLASADSIQLTALFCALQLENHWLKSKSRMLFVESLGLQASM
jgi:hypothetical protein